MDRRSIQRSADHAELRGDLGNAGAEFGLTLGGNLDVLRRGILSRNVTGSSRNSTCVANRQI
jgi:hypothetical protein